MVAQQKQMHQMEALLASTRRRSSDKASREELARAVAVGAENAAGLSKLRTELTTVRVRRNRCYGREGVRRVLDGEEEAMWEEGGGGLIVCRCK